MTCVHPNLVCAKCGETVDDTVPAEVVANMERERRKERDRAQAKMRQATQLLENAPAGDDIQKVVQAWEDRFAPNFRAHRRQSSPGAKGVRRALNWGFTPDDLILAFDGAVRDDWTMGRTPKSAGKRSRLTGLTHLVGDPDRVREFMDLAVKPMELTAPELFDTRSALSERVRQEQQRVRDLRWEIGQRDELIRELVQQLKAERLITEVQSRAIEELNRLVLEAERGAARDERVREAEDAYRQLLPLALAAERAGLAPVIELRSAA
jgi:hypothetical protein